MPRQTSIQLTEATERQVDQLRQFGTFTDIVRIAIDRMAQQEGIVAVRRFTGFDQGIIDGEVTDEELAAARACGYINAYRQGLFEVLDERRASLPEGWALCSGPATHSHDPVPPAELVSPILMGFVRVHHGDPHYPIWLYRQQAQ